MACVRWLAIIWLAHLHHSCASAVDVCCHSRAAGIVCAFLEPQWWWTISKAHAFVLLFTTQYTLIASHMVAVAEAEPSPHQKHTSLYVQSVQERAYAARTPSWPWFVCYQHRMLLDLKNKTATRGRMYALATTMHYGPITRPRHGKTCSRFGMYMCFVHDEYVFSARACNVCCYIIYILSLHTPCTFARYLSVDIPLLHGCLCVCVWLYVCACLPHSVWRVFFFLFVCQIERERVWVSESRSGWCVFIIPKTAVRFQFHLSSWLDTI